MQSYILTYSRIIKEEPSIGPLLPPGGMGWGGGNYHISGTLLWGLLMEDYVPQQRFSNHHHYHISFFQLVARLPLQVFVCFCVCPK